MIPVRSLITIYYNGRISSHLGVRRSTIPDQITSSASSSPTIINKSKTSRMLAVSLQTLSTSFCAISGVLTDLKIFSSQKHQSLPQLFFSRSLGTQPALLRTAHCAVPLLVQRHNVIKVVHRDVFQYIESNRQDQRYKPRLSMSR